MSDVPSVMLEHRPCLFGCREADEIVLSGSDRLHSRPGRFNVVRCRSCGLMRTDPRPTQQTIGTFYPDEYGPHQPPAEPAAHPSLLRRAVRNVLTRFEPNSQRIPPLPPGRLLEIGCASGSFMAQMRERGWEAEGIEFSERAADAARSLGFRVDSAPLERVGERETRYDLICAWMTLEHLHEPVPALEKLWRWTRPGGWLALSVPNAASVEFRLFRDAWYALQLPTHLYHFTPQTIRALLLRTGWQPQRLLHQRTVANLIASCGYAAADRGLSEKLSRRLIEFPDRGGVLHHTLFPVAFILAALGQTGRMTVWARKEP
jgi:2-polyprenyl-3-methyl-5-hydroxy-6-metoxy-1,4-benzoquinol methylase